VLTAQAHGDDRGEAAENQPISVDQHPLLLHVGSLDAKGFHRSFFREAALMGARRGKVKWPEIMAKLQCLMIEVL
jgi:hypothetical protein